MSDDATSPTARPVTAGMPPAASAIAGFTVAALAVLGQNAVTAGVISLLGPNLFADSQTGYELVWGLAVLLQAAVAWFLVRPALSVGTGWVSGLARAGVAVSVVAAAAGVLLVIGALLTRAGLF